MPSAHGTGVRAFGSYDTGLHLPSSDVDLVILGTGYTDRQEQPKALNKFAEALRGANWKHRQLEVVGKAKVPIVKFVDEETGVAVDICFETRDGLKTSALARKAVETFPGACFPCKALIEITSRTLLALLEV